MVISPFPWDLVEFSTHVISLYQYLNFSHSWHHSHKFLEGIKPSDPNFGWNPSLLLTKSVTIFKYKIISSKLFELVSSNLTRSLISFLSVILSLICMRCGLQSSTEFYNHVISCLFQLSFLSRNFYHAGWHFFFWGVAWRAFQLTNAYFIVRYRKWIDNVKRNEKKEEGQAIWLWGV